MAWIKRNLFWVVGGVIALALLGGQKSMDEIAYDAGYRERTGFLRAFRKIYGCEPAAYRADLAAGDVFVAL